MPETKRPWRTLVTGGPTGRFTREQIRKAGAMIGLDVTERLEGHPVTHLCRAPLVGRVITRRHATPDRPQHRDTGGSQGEREYIRHPGAVAIVALTEDRKLLLERQYRYPPRREFIEKNARPGRTRPVRRS